MSASYRQVIKCSFFEAFDPFRDIIKMIIKLNLARKQLFDISEWLLF